MALTKFIFNIILLRGYKKVTSILDYNVSFVFDMIWFKSGLHKGFINGIEGVGYTS